MARTVEPGRRSLIYLDTHVALWLCTGEVPLSEGALRAIESGELSISPMVLLEFRFLFEIGRLNARPEEWLAILRGEFDVQVCSLPFQDVVEAAWVETWTRDPFDRMIVAQAKVGGGKLVTRDRRIREHFGGCVW